MKIGLLLLLVALAACGGGDRQAASDTSAVAASTSSAVADAGSEGAALYQRCVTCHQANGEGTAGTFPPLVGSEYATAANVAVPIRILIHGIEGPLTVKGVQYSGIMPAYGVGVEMSNEEVAAVLTYVRQSWGNNASAITAEQVAATKAAPRSRTGAVNAEELKGMM